MSIVLRNQRYQGHKNCQFVQLSNLTNLWNVGARAILGLIGREHLLRFNYGWYGQIMSILFSRWRFWTDAWHLKWITPVKHDFVDKKTDTYASWIFLKRQKGILSPKILKISRYVLCRFLLNSYIFSRTQFLPFFPDNWLIIESLLNKKKLIKKIKKITVK